MDLPVERLREWFLKTKRELPWRLSPTPYQVWVSEVMLQQTQVAVVVPYYKRWMSQFPDVKTLAEAKIEIVLKFWEGLGYYSRAHNLHEGAKKIMTSYGGKIPSTSSELLKIKGIGAYTSAAILSFAFKQKKLPLDGNVMRVLSRYFLIEEDICKPSIHRLLIERGEGLLPVFEPWTISEALIELGALVCQKKPKCQKCPLQKECLAHRYLRQTDLPIKRKPPRVTLLHRNVAVITDGLSVLLQKGGIKGKALTDLYEFLYIEGECLPAQIFCSQLEEKLKLQLNYQCSLTHQEYTFTRFRVKLYPHLFKAETLKKFKCYQWEAINDLPFSSGHRRILGNVYPFHFKNWDFGCTKAQFLK
ncbi:MAG: A/G-specific adenine glycosylase [Chlamydiia bacterium]|nr:A/G-specific adenine glycosylase [Chlamydiia bacterium]